MSRSRPLSVYVLGQPNGPQKIGISDNVPGRLLNLRGRSNLRIVFQAARRSGDARYVEKIAKVLLADHQLPGEMFLVTTDVAVATVKHAIELIDGGLGHTVASPPLPQINYKPGRTVGVRLDPEVKVFVEQAAAAEGRSLSKMIARLCKEWLDDRGKIEGKEE
jgi:hypothetical protein